MSHRPPHPVSTTPGIVLSRRRHQEKDIRLHLFLRSEGKVICTVKGGQSMASKFKALQEPFIFAEYQIYMAPNAVLAKLLGGKLLHSHFRIRLNLEAFGVASTICETIEALFPFRAPAPEIFDILQASLNALHGFSSPKTTRLWFSINLLRALGHGDKTAELSVFIQPVEREKVKKFLADTRLAIPFDALSLSNISMDRCLKFMDNNIKELLPRGLNSDGFEQALFCPARKLI